MKEGYHIFTQSISLPLCDVAGTATGSSKSLEKDWQFEIVRIKSDGNYVIRLLRWKDVKDAGQKALNASKNTNFYGTDASPIYFLLTTDEYKNNAERIEKKGTFTVGAGTTLIKIRPGREDQELYTDFVNDFNIGVMAGFKFKPYRRRELSHSLLGGISFGSVGVSSNTTKNVITEETDAASISFSGGYVFEYNKFQLGLFTGIDVLSGKAGRYWVYKKRPWLGLGFGYSIFRAEGKGQQ